MTPILGQILAWVAGVGFFSIVFIFLFGLKRQTEARPYSSKNSVQHSSPRFSDKPTDDAVKDGVNGALKPFFFDSPARVALSATTVWGLVWILFFLGDETKPIRTRVAVFLFLFPSLLLAVQLMKRSGPGAKP